MPYKAKRELPDNVQNVLPVSTSQGAVDWACTSATNVSATGRSLGNRAIPATNPVPAKFMPSECR